MGMEQTLLQEKYQWYGYGTDLATGEVPVVWARVHSMEPAMKPTYHLMVIPGYHSTHALFISLVFIVYLTLVSRLTTGGLRSPDNCLLASTTSNVPR